jgi:hypothetical protein
MSSEPLSQALGVSSAMVCLAVVHGALTWQVPPHRLSSGSLDGSPTPRARLAGGDSGSDAGVERPDTRLRQVGRPRRHEVHWTGAWLRSAGWTGAAERRGGVGGARPPLRGCTSAVDGVRPL